MAVYIFNLSKSVGILNHQLIHTALAGMPPSEYWKSWGSVEGRLETPSYYSHPFEGIRRKVKHANCLGIAENCFSVDDQL